ISGALEALSLAVFVCDRWGVVRSMTPDAEAIVSQGNMLTLKRGVLASHRPQETRALNDAIAKASARLEAYAKPQAGTVIIGSGTNSPPLILDVLPIPRQNFAFGFDSRVLIVAKGGKS